MLTQKGLAHAEEIRIKLRNVLNANNGELFHDAGLNSWRKHLSDITASGMAPEGVVVGWKNNHTEPINIEHIEDGDLAMEEGCLEAYLQSRGLVDRTRI